MCTQMLNKKFKELKDHEILLILPDEKKCLGVHKDKFLFLAMYNDEGEIFHKHLINKEQMKGYIKKISERMGVC